MNAPINIALLRAAAGIAPITLRDQQPTVTPGTRVLVVGHEHDGVLLDLHGMLDAAGYDVVDVTLTGELVAITALFHRDVLLQMSDWCNRKLPSAHDLRLVSIDEARIDLHEWEQNFRPP